MPEVNSVNGAPETGAVKKKKGLSFGQGLLIYTMILLLLGGAALYLLQDFLVAYEASRPQYCVEAYQASLSKGLPAAAAEALSGLDPQVRDPAENQRWAAELLRGARLVKDPALSGEEELVYQILAEDGQTLGQVRFTAAGKTRYDLPVWSMSGDSFDFSVYYRSTGVTVPSDYRVYLGERLLGSECIAESGIPYQELAECYQHYDNLPTMVRYETMPFLGEPSLRILDQDGNEVSEEQLSESAFLDRCPAEVRERADAFTAEFIDLYVNFTADIDDDSNHYYFDQLRRRSVRDSQIYTRLRMAFEGFGWSATKSVNLKEVHIDHISVLGQNRYLTDVRYVTLVNGYGGKAELNDHLQLVLIDQNGKLLADALYYAE